MYHEQESDNKIIIGHMSPLESTCYAEDAIVPVEEKARVMAYSTFINQMECQIHLCTHNMVLCTYSSLFLGIIIKLGLSLTSPSAISSGPIGSDTSIDLSLW